MGYVNYFNTNTGSYKGWQELIPYTKFAEFTLTKEDQELLPIMARDREKLSEGFQPEKTEWLNKYDAILNEMSAMAEVEAFKFGFRLATAILLETAQ